MLPQKFHSYEAAEKIQLKDNSVFTVRNRNQEFVLKTMRVDQSNKQGAIDYVELMMKLKHPNVIAIEEYFLLNEDGFLCVVMEKHDSSLAHQLQNNKAMNKQRKLEIMLDASMGLCFLHRHGIVHEDIRPENILIFGQIAKIGDCLSSVLGRGDFREKQRIPYAAPQTSANQLTNKADVWALGITFVELLMQKRVKNINQCMQYSNRDSPVENAQVQKVMKSMLKIEPMERASSRQVKQFLFSISAHQAEVAWAHFIAYFEKRGETEAAKYFKHAGWEKIKYFNFSWTKITDAGMEVLGRTYCPQLSALIINTNNLTDGAVQSLIRANWPKLQEIKINATNLTTADKLPFASWPHLRHLDLSDNKLTNANGLQQADWPQLTHLKMSRNRITDISCLHKAHWPNLSYLGLDKDVGGLHLAHWPRLISMKIEDNELSEKGTVNIYKANWPCLEDLNLYNQNLTGLAALKELYEKFFKSDVYMNR